MADVGVLGLGDMGAALAQTLLTAGFDTVVWNRTSSRADALVGAGAHWADTAEAALGAADVVLVCVDDYAATDSFLKTPQAESTLRGRALVQLSSGSPRQAREGKAWADGMGAHYVDGAIMAFPSEIGGRETTIVASGDETGFQRAEPLLRALAGNTAYLGSDAGLASALDQALISGVLGTILGVVNGVLLCEAGGFPAAQYAEILGGFMTTLGAQAQAVARRAAEGDYRETQAALRTWARALEHAAETTREAGASDEVARFISGLFRRAVEAGHGDHDIAALIEVLRKPAADG